MRRVVRTMSTPPIATLPPAPDQTTSASIHRETQGISGFRGRSGNLTEGFASGGVNGSPRLPRYLAREESPASVHAFFRSSVSFWLDQSIGHAGCWLRQRKTLLVLVIRETEAGDPLVLKFPLQFIDFPEGARSSSPSRSMPAWKSAGIASTSSLGHAFRGRGDRAGRR
jgi:hypothetical protein